MSEEERILKRRSLMSAAIEAGTDMLTAVTLGPVSGNGVANVRLCVPDDQDVWFPTLESIEAFNVMDKEIEADSFVRLIQVNGRWCMFFDPDLKSQQIAQAWKLSPCEINRTRVPLAMRLP